MPWEDYSRPDPGQIEREIARRRELGEPFEQVTCEVARGMPASTFWGKAWGLNLEHYSDYEGRLPRGRNYLRKGNVYDLSITEGEIFAYVTGAEIYEVLVRIDPLDGDRWETVKAKTAGEIANLVALLSGSLGPGVLETITDPDGGLFPEPAEIHLSCSCPDWADMCKHVAATLYAVGIRLDEKPELFFTLRGVNQEELIDAASDSASRVDELADDDPGTQVLAAEDLSELFGIEITEPEAAFADLDDSKRPR